MDKRYGEMTAEELRREIAELTEKARKAEQLGVVNEYAVLQRKITMAKAYMMDPDDFKPGETYDVEGDPGATFKVSFINGTFAWGYRSGNQEQEAFPISMLIKHKESRF